MKKLHIFNILIFIFMALTLCACDKSDYKKALEADEADDFETAIELYSKLARKKYKDSDTRLDTIRVRRELTRMEQGSWDEADCRLLTIHEETAYKLTGITYISERCYLEKAAFLQQNGRHEEALKALDSVIGSIPEEYDLPGMKFDTELAICKAIESDDERFDCLGKMSPNPMGIGYRPESRYQREWIKNITNYLKDNNAYYENPDISKSLFLRSIGLTEEFSGELDFGTMMERCLDYFSENRLNRSICMEEYVFDMLYFEDGDPVSGYQDAENWAAEHEQKMTVDWLKNAAKRCISRPSESKYSGTVYPINAPAICEIVLKPELQTWLTENSDIISPAEGFWDSDSFREIYDPDGTQEKYNNSYAIRSLIKPEDIYPKSVSIIIDSSSQFSSPFMIWRDHPEITQTITDWVNEAASKYKSFLKDWVFIDEPERAAYILYLNLSYEKTGSFSGIVSDKSVSVNVYNLDIAGELWTNRPGIDKSKSFHIRTNLGQENTVWGVNKDLVSQHLVIASEDPLTFYGADYHPESGIAWPDSILSAFSNTALEWLSNQEKEFEGN